MKHRKQKVKLRNPEIQKEYEKEPRSNVNYTSQAMEARLQDIPYILACMNEF